MKLFRMRKTEAAAAGRKGFPRVGLLMRVALLYIVIIIVMLAILNVYPIYVSQNFIFRTKQDTMQERASLFASALSGLDVLDEESVLRRMSSMDDSGTARCIITDESFQAVYDNSLTDNKTGKKILLQEIRHALERNNVFYAEYDGSTILSKATTPVIVNGRVIGAVYLYETDDELAALLSDIQRNLMNISLIVSVVVAILSTMLLQLISRRVQALLRAIRRFGEGDYSHRVQVSGNDELNEIAAEFNKFSEKFENVEEMRRRFVSDASHELKTPLASVKILADTIGQNEDMPPEMMREFANDIGDEVNRLSRLTEKLLSITRMDADIVREIYPVDLGEVVRRAAHMLAPLLQGGDIRLELSLDEQCYISANDDDAYQIIFNLLENAIKYNKESGAVRVFLYEKLGSIILIVDDTGIGIPEEDIDKIFTRFYRVDKARSRDAGGSGLGLSIVKNTAEQYGGEIEISSKVGEGTRITIAFPAADGHSPTYFD